MENWEVFNSILQRRRGRHLCKHCDGSCFYCELLHGGRLRRRTAALWFPANRPAAQAGLAGRASGRPDTDGVRHSAPAGPPAVASVHRPPDL